MSDTGKTEIRNKEIRAGVEAAYEAWNVVYHQVNALVELLEADKYVNKSTKLLVKDVQNTVEENYLMVSDKYYETVCVCMPEKTKGGEA